MRSVTIVLTAPQRVADDVFATIADFRRYPVHCTAVRSVVVSPGLDARSLVSSWEVNFRGGILRWVEEDSVDAVARRIEFRQLDGDLAAFHGSWTCTPDGDDVIVEFASHLDLGIPSLADALEPIAIRTLVDNTVAIVRGLLGDDVRLERVDDARPAQLAP